MISSRKLSDLHPLARDKALAFKRKCKAQGIDVLIYCTLRDNEEQNRLYAKGRTTKGRKVTNARGGQSEHNYGIAWDCVPLDGGKAMWGDRASYKKMGAIAESLGIDWAGNWKRFKETAHFSFKDGHSLLYFKRGGSL
jgi:peptidoglycan L-alanyl-D-glutamate endopeptidase CwlK|tara:strand:- start:743 stop:1156 length:414 start_codon:yes stop_codon:yes gene_type:complete